MTTTLKPSSLRSLTARGTPGRRWRSSTLRQKWTSRTRVPSRSRKTALYSLVEGPPDFPQTGSGKMAHEEVDILNLFHRTAGHHQADIHHPLQLPTIKRGEADGGSPRLFGQAEGIEDVLGIAAAAYPYHHIPGLEPGGELAGEDLLVRKVIGPRRKEGQAIGEGKGLNGGLVGDHGPLGQVAGKMGSGGRRAPVATDEDLLSLQPGLLQAEDNRLYLLQRQPGQALPHLGQVALGKFRYRLDLFHSHPL